jgi:hypothetical protein
VKDRRDKKMRYCKKCGWRTNYRSLCFRIALSKLLESKIKGDIGIVLTVVL